MAGTISELSIKDIAHLANEAFTRPERTQVEDYWRDLDEFINNNNFSQLYNGGGTTALTTWAAGVNSGTAAGARNTNRVFDGTAGRAATSLGSFIHGTLTNPASPWLNIKYSGKAESLNDDEESVRILAEVVRDIRTKIAESNFSDTMIKVYMSYVTLGNASLFNEIKPDGQFRFTAIHMGQIAWAEDPDNRIDTVFRKITMTVKQAVQQWGPSISENIGRLLTTNPLEEIEVLQVIMPRDSSKIKLDEFGEPALNALPQERPIASIYLDAENTHLLEEGGFYEMPIFGARFHTQPGEVYGRGPGHLALPDILTLNKLKKLSLEAETLNVKRPILANQRDIIGGQLRIKPGQVTVVKSIDGIKPWDLGNRTQTIQMTVEELTRSINESFFLDKLILPPRTETGEMTAFEVAKRLEQTQVLLGPVLSRLNNEVLEPLILRMFMSKLRAGEIELSPLMSELGIDIKVVFNNPFNQAQQIQDVLTMNQWLQFVAETAQLNPIGIDNVDFDGAILHAGKVLGVAFEAIKSPEKRDKEREERAEAAEKQVLIDNAATAANAASQLDSVGG